MADDAHRAHAERAGRDFRRRSLFASFRFVSRALLAICRGEQLGEFADFAKYGADDIERATAPFRSAQPRLYNKGTNGAKLSRLSLSLRDRDVARQFASKLGISDLVLHSITVQICNSFVPQRRNWNPRARNRSNFHYRARGGTLEHALKYVAGLLLRPPLSGLQFALPTPKLTARGSRSVSFR